MMLSERQRLQLQLAIAVLRPSIEAMIEATGKQLDDVKAQMVSHVQDHYAELDKLLRSASGIGSLGERRPDCRIARARQAQPPRDRSPGRRGTDGQ